MARLLRASGKLRGLSSPSALREGQALSSPCQGKDPRPCLCLLDVGISVSKGGQSGTISGRIDACGLGPCNTLRGLTLAAEACLADVNRNIPSPNMLESNSGDSKQAGAQMPDSLHKSSQKVEAAVDNTASELKNTGQKISERHNLAMIYTCNVCQTRSAKTMSRQTYEQGVVIVRCGGCKNLHLIADRLGWFGEPGSVEDFLAHKGFEVRKGSEESYEFGVEDLTGWTPAAKKE